MNNALILLIFCLSAPAMSKAALTTAPYAGAALERQTISIDTNDFDSGLLLLHAGVWIWEGIGLELELGTSIFDDTQNAVSVEHKSLLRYGIRLQTPATPNNTLLYVLLSGASSKLNMQTGGDGVPGKSRFSGYHAGVGLATQLSAKVQLDLSYNNYQVDESIDITGIRLNVEYSFGAINR